MPQTVAMMGSATLIARTGPSTRSDSEKNISLERKPFNSGTPAIAAAATIASVAVIGMNRYRPDSRRMSRVPDS